MQLIRLIVSVLRSFLLCILLLCTTACLALGLMRVMPVPALSAERTSQVAPRDTTAKASRHHKTKGKEQTPSAVHDTLSNGTPIAFQTDSTGRNITFALDSTATDSTRADSAHKKDGLDQPVAYEANDSSTYIADTRLTTLYGDSKVRYQDMTLSAARISMNNDSTLAHAYADRDSTGELIGKPVYTQNSDNYESEEMSYNFKTKKGFIKNVSTEQGQGFLNSQSSKRANDGTLYLQHAKYTTCDAEHPHFYLALSRAKVRPGKEAVFGPAYLVVEDVPLPLAIPGGFFPFTRKYSSGFIVPSYGSETSRGFYLRDGGYYFAINDRIDLTLLGELYTKGSWGLNASSTYKKRYKYSGSFYVNYLNTIEGEKNMPDYSKTTSFKIQWTHRQDPKASMFSQLSASVNFATQSFERSNLASLYNPTAYTQATRTSSVSYSRTIPSLGMTLSASTNLSQNMTDSTIALSLPELNISVSRFYPFRRKHQVGKQRWYEKIAMTYTGQLSNSITTKESKLLHSDLIKDWRNGMSHSIPVSASFNLFKYVTVTPSFTFRDRMYTNKVMQSWDTDRQSVVRDTTYGFYNVYNWNMSVSANTTLYGFYKPWKFLFGDKIIAVRHVLKPSVSYSYAPDFGASRYGYWDSYVKTDAHGNVSTVTYSPFARSLFSVPGRGKTGSISLAVSNNLEMKVKSDKDSTGEKKISLIDELSGSISYNMASATRPWSDLSTRLRLKLTKNYTFSLAAVFATYAYQFDKNGNVYVGDRTEWSYGRFGRFQGMSQNLSYTISNNTFKKKKRTNSSSGKGNTNTDNDTDEANEEGDTNVDPDLKGGNAPDEGGESQSQVGPDGYLKFSLPWSLTLSYGITMRENTSARINPRTMRYPYKFSQTLNFNGYVRLSQGWNINYNSGYDFNYHKLSMTTASLSRDLHCFSMTCSIVLKPYTSFNFTFRANMSTLADLLKWEKRSSYSSNIEWK